MKMHYLCTRIQNSTKVLPIKNQKTMNALFSHNITAGWRNILKYKTQNIISVLCLSVGVLCFAISLYFINVLWENTGKKAICGGIVNTYAMNKEDSRIISLDYQTVKQMESLPAVKSISYMSGTVGADTEIRCKNSHAIMGGGIVNTYAIVSPGWLRENNFYSATTGKRVEVLKPGTIIMERRAAKRMFGVETLIGGTINFNGKTRTISDVVYSDTYYGTMADILVVNSKEFASFFSTINSRIYINDGYTKAQLEAQVKAKMPKYTWELYEINDKTVWIVLLFIALTLLGASVLIIGLAGFLKMQLQLFILRTREMALRRCNGAKPTELLMLLCAELLIIFGFVAVVSMLISWGFEAYAMPKLAEFVILDQLDFQPSIVYKTELVIVVLSFAVSVLIAWITVRRSLKAPLSDNVKTNFTQRTKWNSTMQIVQYVVAVILFFFIAFMFKLVNENSKKFRLPASPSYYKNIVSVSMAQELGDKLEKLPSVGMSGKIFNVEYSISQKEDSTNYVPHREMPVENNDTVNIYEPVITDAAVFKILMENIRKDYCLDKDSFLDNVPVYVRKEKVASVMKYLGIDYKVSEEKILLPDGNKYMQIGYAERFPYAKIHFQQIGLYIIEDKDVFLKNQKRQSDKAYCRDWLILPKDNDVDAFNKDFDALCHKVENIPADTHLYPPTTYDEWFVELKLMNFIRELLSILTLVSLTSIVLTVFSSISLETRGKKKEVAIRKVNGAKTRDIVMLFSRYYIFTLSIAFSIALLLGILIVCGISIDSGSWPDLDSFWNGLILPFITSVLVITGVTVLTLWHKIYKISHINPANLINKE